MTYIYIGSGIFVWLLIVGILKKRQERNRVVHVVEMNCTGCGRCLKRCNHNVFEMANAEQGKHIVVKYPNRCEGCGDCVPKCKFNALEMVKR
jgi:NAD-dependent dihydropyrimidine dehydrogenase PreA subunit